MNNKYIIYLLVLVLIIYLFKKYEHFSNVVDSKQSDILQSDILPFDNIKIPNVPIPKIQLLKKGEKIDLLDLPYCDEKFKASYSSNTNHIVNDGSKIYQDVQKPYEQTAEISDKPQGLTQISWKKSYFTWNDQPIGLELQFSHVNPKTGKIIIVSFPLSFTPLEETEQFTNLKSNPDKANIRAQLDNSSSSGFEKLGKLNTLIKTPQDVPEKTPGRVNIGDLLTFDLCEPASLILEQRKFFFATTTKDELLMISKPQLFSREIGFKILDNLDDPEEDLIIP